MSTTAVRDAAEYESRLQEYYFERAEEARAVRMHFELLVAALKRKGGLVGQDRRYGLWP